MLRHVVVIIRIFFITLHVVSIDQRLDTFFQIGRLQKKEKIINDSNLKKRVIFQDAMLTLTGNLS